MLDNVIAADFSPDGQAIAAIVGVNGNYSLQFPIGTERLNTAYPISHVRVAPDGEHVAYLSHPLGGDEGDVRVVAKTGEPRTISTGWISLGGLAWANGGKELWFTATRKGGVRALWATTLDGHERELYSSTERLALEDVAPDGRALLSAGRLRAHVLYGSNAGRSPGTLHLTRRTAARGWWTRAREIPARSGDGIEDPTQRRRAHTCGCGLHG
jgi:hypothetical protein